MTSSAANLIGPLFVRQIDFNLRFSALLNTRVYMLVGQNDGGMAWQCPRLSAKLSSIRLTLIYLFFVCICSRGSLVLRVSTQPTDLLWDASEHTRTASSPIRVLCLYMVKTYYYYMRILAVLPLTVASHQQEFRHLIEYINIRMYTTEQQHQVKHTHINVSFNQSPSGSEKCHHNIVSNETKWPCAHSTVFICNSSSNRSSSAIMKAHYVYT